MRRIPTLRNSYYRRLECYTSLVRLYFSPSRLSIRADRYFLITVNLKLCMYSADSPLILSRRVLDWRNPKLYCTYSTGRNQHLYQSDCSTLLDELRTALPRLFLNRHRRVYSRLLHRLPIFLLELRRRYYKW